MNIDDVKKLIKIKSSNNPEFKTDKDRLLWQKYCQSIFSNANSVMADKFSKWEEIDRQYEFESEIFEEEQDKYIPLTEQSRLPIINSQINAMIAHLVPRLYDPASNFIVVKDWDNGMRRYDIETKVYNSFKRANGSLVISEAILQASLYGRGIVKVAFDPDKGYPVYELVSVYDFWSDPDATLPDDMEFTIRRLWWSEDKLIRMMEEGKLDKKQVMDLLQSESQSNVETGVSDEYFSFSVSSSYTIKKYNRYEILEIINNKYITYCACRNGEILSVLRRIVNDIGNPYFFIYINLPTNNQQYVKSYAELILPYQQEANWFASHKKENVKSGVRPTLLVQQNALDNPDDLRFNERRIIMVNDINGIKWVNVPDMTQQALQEISFCYTRSAEITGVSSIVTGGVAKKERMTTAETSAVYGASEMPFSLSANIACFTGIIPILKYTLKLLNLNDSIKLNYLQEAGIQTAELQIRAEKIREDSKDFEMYLEVQPNKVMQDKNNWFSFLQLAQTNPVIDQTKLWQNSLPRILPDAPLDLVKNPQDIQVNPQTGQPIQANPVMTRGGGLQ